MNPLPISELSSGISRDDVVWCFKHIFGREPDSDSTVKHLLSTERSFRTLVTTLLASHEYQALFARSQLRGVDRDGFVYDDLASTQDRVMSVLRKIRPQLAHGYGKIRIGKDGDGGYIMLDDFEGIEAAYSLGIKDDVTWDKEIASRGIDIYQYDHTIESLPEQNERFHWFRIGIAGQPDGNLDTLPNLMRKNGHATSTELILKCDIEGNEWEMLERMTPAELGQFRQIVLETHGWGYLSDAEFSIRIERAIANITVAHRLIHVHANNHAGYAIVGGVPIPAVLELTFARAARYKMIESLETFPTPLDMPCSDARADYQLGNFRF